MWQFFLWSKNNGLQNLIGIREIDQWARTRINPWHGICYYQWDTVGIFRFQRNRRIKITIKFNQSELKLLRKVSGLEVQLVQNSTEELLKTDDFSVKQSSRCHFPDIGGRVFTVVYFNVTEYLSIQWTAQQLKFLDAKNWNIRRPNRTTGNIM